MDSQNNAELIIQINTEIESENDDPSKEPILTEKEKKAKGMFIIFLFINIKSETNVPIDTKKLSNTRQPWNRGYFSVPSAW